MTDQNTKNGGSTATQNQNDTAPKGVHWMSILGSIFAVGGILLLVFGLLLIINCTFFVDANIGGCFIAPNDNDINLVNLYEGAIATTGLLLTGVALRFFSARLEDQQKQTEIQTEVLKDQKEQTKLQTRAVRDQEQQTKMQIQQFNAETRKEIDDRYRSAVALLGNSDATVRMESVYSLHHLVLESMEYHESQKYHARVAKILCAYICSKTNEEGYQSTHPEFPSSDVQAAIDVLFKNSHQMPGLYQKFENDLPRANLHRAYLVGADFLSAKCNRVVFGGTNCQNAWFWEAECTEANFVEADCRGANFTNAKCRNAQFESANCQGAKFVSADCERAFFRRANCQKVTFWVANCQWAIFIDANCRGADFSGARCNGAAFDGADTTNARGLKKEEEDDDD